MDLKMMISGLLSIIKYSTRKMLFSKRWVIVLLLVVLIGAIMGYAGSMEGDRLDGGTNLMDFLILSFILPVVAMIYGASLIRNEIDDKSITQVITSPLPRPVSYIGYYISLVISLSMIMVLINSVGWLAFFGQQGMGRGAGNILLVMMVLGVIGSIVYSSLFLMFSVVFKRPHFIRSIGSSWLDYGMISFYDGASVGTAFGVLTVITIFCLALGAILFRGKEYP
jgi:ABC-type transport system involved in multi-copper enzyme maturation permease subunit